MTSGPELHDLACVIHVHSRYSDGTATVPEIVAAAAGAGADAVLLTDHDTLGGRRDGWEGWHGSVLLLVGLEVSPPGGHLLAFGVDREVDHARHNETELAAQIAAAGGLGFPAHPFSAGSLISARIGRPHPWRALEGDSYAGIELWSLVTETAERCASMRELWSFLRDPLGFITAPPAENLAAWDRLCARRQVVAIGGLDSHQTGIRLGGRVWSPLTHAKLFRTLRTHVLLERPPARDLATDRAAVYGALRAGRCFLALDHEAPATGFSFWAAGPGATAAMGEQAPAGEWQLRATLPGAAQLRLVRDGREVARRGGRELRHDVREPGVYRVEAWRGDRIWVISNPIYLRARPGPRADRRPGDRSRSW